MYNKFIKKDGEVLLDLTDDSVSSSDLLQGITAHDKSGEVIEGSIPIKTSEDLTINGAMVTVPKGYYASSVTESVATATQATPNIIVNASGLITATATQTAGYVVAGTKSSTHQLAFQAAKTITPSTASQIAVSSGYYTGGNITVAAVPTQSKTVTPTSSAQNITPDNGKFLSKVTVNGDSDLVAGNIKSGVNIFGVTGTYVGSGGGDTSVEDGIITKTISSYTNDRVTSIGSYAFYYCTKLTTASFPVATTIASYAFRSCYHLKSLYLTGSSICTLSHSNAFSSTPIGGYSISARTYGSIYVPASLLASYKTATNWAYFSSRFVGI